MNEVQFQLISQTHVHKVTHTTKKLRNSLFDHNVFFLQYIFFLMCFRKEAAIYRNASWGPFIKDVPSQEGRGTYADKGGFTEADCGRPNLLLQKTKDFSKNYSGSAGTRGVEAVRTFCRHRGRGSFFAICGDVFYEQPLRVSPSIKIPFALVFENSLKSVQIHHANIVVLTVYLLFHVFIVLPWETWAIEQQRGYVVVF